MRRSILCTVVVLGLLAGGLFWRKPAPSQPTPAHVSLLVRFGLKASQQEKWDGTVRVAGGVLVSIEGHHFSASDEVTAPGAWKCATRTDEVAPYADLHYTEMRPGSLPEVMHKPVGVVVTMQPGVATRVNVETAQGNFDFA